MTTHRLNDQKYSLKGAAQCSDKNGRKTSTLEVLAGANGANFSSESAPSHAQVVLQEGSGPNAEPIAYFTTEQARQLATALNAAAGGHDAVQLADC